MSDSKDIYTLGIKYQNLELFKLTKSGTIHILDFSHQKRYFQLSSALLS